ncbi:MAG: acetyltransferase [Bacilli bacterium]|nr:acetyltransferase [Bacilli bacterium]
MKEKLLIIGAGGHGKVCADIALKMQKWKTITFLDDNENIKEVLSIKVIGKTKDFTKFIDSHDIFVAIGNNYTRKSIIELLTEHNASIPTLVHPCAVIASNVTIDMGSVVMANVVINSDSKIGKGCILNTASTIDHDNIIGDYVHISPGVNLAGNVIIGNCTWLGIGSKVINNISISCDCIIGAGGVVIDNINEVGKYVGVPVRRLYDNEKNIDISK